MRSALQSLDGIESADVSLSAENAVVVYQPEEKTSIEDMKKAVKKAGYGITGNSDPKPLKKETQSEDSSESSSSDESETGISTVLIEQPDFL